MENTSMTTEGIVITELCKQLKRIAQSKYLGVEYLTICAYVLECIEKYLGEDYDFPINIEEIASKMGAQIVYQPLNRVIDTDDVQKHHVVGRNLKRINRITKQQISNILIDFETGRREQRYALAHELAHFLIHYNDRLYNDAYCIMPMLFKDMEEMVADLFATFMLIPVPIFLKELISYIGDKPVPVETSKWLKYLSIIAEIPYEYAIIGYQNIRYLCGMLYTFSEKSEADIEKGEQQTNEEANNIVQKWITRLQNCLTDEVVEKLFE